MVNLDVLIKWFTLIASGIAVAGFLLSRREIAVKEGENKRIIKEHTDDISSLKCDVREMKKAETDVDKDLVEIKTTLRFMAEAVKRIEVKVDTIAPPTVKNEEGQ